VKQPFNRKVALYLQANLGEFIEDPAKREDAEDNVKNLLDCSMGQHYNKVSYLKGKEALDETKGRWYAETPWSHAVHVQAYQAHSVQVSFDCLNFVNYSLGIVQKAEHQSPASAKVCAG
jgi:hypothetical protein